MAPNPFLRPETRQQHARLCAADAFRYAEEKATRGVAEHPDGPGLNALSLTALVKEIRDEAADQSIYATQLEQGIVAGLSVAVTELVDELDSIQECDAQLDRARSLAREILRFVR